MDGLVGIQSLRKRGRRRPAGSPWPRWSPLETAVAPPHTLCPLHARRGRSGLAGASHEAWHPVPPKPCSPPQGAVSSASPACVCSSGRADSGPASVPCSRFCVHSSDASARVWATTTRGEADSVLLSRGARYVPLALSTREGVGWAGPGGFLLRGGAVLGPHLRGPCLAYLCMTALSFSRSFSGVAVPAPSLGVLRRRTWGLGSRDTVCQ